MIHALKALLAALLLAATVWAQPQQDSPFVISDIKADEVSPGVVNVSLTTTTLRAIGPVATVPVPVAPLLLTGTIPLRQILETDILGSSLSMDLDGDGRLDVVPVRQTEEGLRIEGALIEPMGEGAASQQPRRSNGEMRRYVLSPDGPDFSVLFYNAPDIGLLLSHRNIDPEVLDLPNPSLQLVVFELSDTVEGPRFLPDPPTFKLSMDGQEVKDQHLLYAWEPALFQSLNRSPRWLRAYWFAVPLNPDPSVTKHNLQVQVGKGTSPVGLYAQIDYAPSPGVQMRTNRSTGLIWSPRE